MDVRVLDTFKGEKRPVVLRIQGDHGADCRASIGGFPVGSTWIFAVLPDEDKDATEVSLSSCGQYWLGLDQGVVRGRINSSRVTQMKLEDFRRMLPIS